MQDSEAQPFGMNLDDQEYDRLMHLHARADWLEFEGALFSCKWFDYRFMNPVAATYLYAAAYHAAYKRFYAKTIDREAAQYVKPLKNEDLFKCKPEFISAIWRGRQHADAMGVSYPEYLDAAFEGVLRFWNRPHMPRPAQLYSGEVCKYVGEKWERNQLGHLYVGAHRAYRTQNYSGSPAQNDHHEWLLEQATKRSNSFMSLTDMFSNELLPIEKIRTRFGDEVAERILQAA